MMGSAVKTAFMIMLGVIIGAGQVCACASSLLLSENKVAAFAHEGHKGHAGQADHDAPAKTAHGALHDAHDPHSDHEAPCDQGCAHCDQLSLFKPVKSSNHAPLLAPPAPEEPALFVEAPASRCGATAPKNKNSIAWLEPPPPTPITLKVRLLN